MSLLQLEVSTPADGWAATTASVVAGICTSQPLPSPGCTSTAASSTLPARSMMDNLVFWPRPESPGGAFGPPTPRKKGLQHIWTFRGFWSVCAP